MNKTYTIDEIKKITVPVAQKYGVKKLALFGSYARGKQKDTSDIDFLIDKVDSRELFAYFGFINALEDNFGIHVDVLTYDSLKDSFIGNIEDVMKNEVILYER